ncbi:MULTISPECIES: 2-succinyl-5-enolpyruvyl-6-hydroxy-3-cyclohexene-1-carboxylic-acid synthase [unclassified Leucobacter]|uniref:2-succinyl-5-enolpyruvyl-6-hydroxy-3- cyclohexene-1-carboxylic-acid synthase n=1 Tax=unclassified Leucobacter TaxID=2621730 RepID=UPI0030163F4F
MTDASHSSDQNGGLAAASVFAVELLGELIRRGVSDVVVCPGSRSQALALAAAAAEQVGAIRLHVRLDERSAAFFALGVARETGMPAPVIVTSGTAVANLAPAVLEAHEARVPLLLMTADRPVELRGMRSNQTTRQAGFFGPVARLSLDVPAPSFGDDGDLVRGADRDPGSLARVVLQAALGAPGAAPAGPVQLNIAFREPLSGTQGFDGMIARGFEAAAEERAALQVADPAADPDPYLHRGDALAVVIAGEGAGLEAEAFAHAAGLPLLAEVVSGARFGREAIAGYAALLTAQRADGPPLGELVEQAIVFGHPTLTRAVPALLRRDDVEVVVVDPHPRAEHYDPSRAARVVRSARVAADHEPRALRRWLGAWVTADRELLRERSTVHEPDLEAALATGYKERNAYARTEVAVMREPISRELLVESVWRATWPHDRLVLAASRLVRVLDGLAPARRVAVHANRGLAGIDGTVATALGVAAASQGDPDPAKAAGTTRVIIGDLALLHDAGSLLLPEGEPAPRMQLFVGNDGGGTIFDGLEVAGSADPELFSRVMRTPQQADLASLARAYGWEYRRVETRGEIEKLLTEPVTGPSLVEIPLAP